MVVCVTEAETLPLVKDVDFCHVELTFVSHNALRRMDVKCTMHRFCPTAIVKFVAR